MHAHLHPKVTQSLLRDLLSHVFMTYGISYTSFLDSCAVLTNCFTSHDEDDSVPVMGGLNVECEGVEVQDVRCRSMDV